MRKIKIFFNSMLGGLFILMASCSPETEYDILITNGFVFDGAGNPWVYSDIGIIDDEIVAMGKLRNVPSKRTIDASGLFVTPGFIDPHSHAAGGLSSAELSHAQPILAQGVTTLITNPCGGGPVDLESQHERLMEHGLGVNVGQLVPHGSIRRAVIGNEDREATPEEIEEMKSLVREAMEYGAFGLSTGLFYTPGIYAPTSEIIELSKVVAEYGGVHQSHIRDESNYTIGVVGSVQEVIDISEASGVTGIVTHIKALGPPVWGASEEIVRMIGEARERGLEIFTDQYPYHASATSMIAAIIPTWAREGGTGELRKRLSDPDLREKIREGTIENLERRGGADRLQFRRFSADPSIEGRTLEEVANEMNLDPVETSFELIMEGSPSVVSFNMNDEDIARFMTRSWNMTSSDGGLVKMGEGVPHPRNYGTFPRRIRKYVFEEELQDIEDAIRSMTSLTSTVFGINDRGVLRPGMKADIAVFDPARITDRAIFTDPHQLSEGMVYVIVNGIPAIDNGEFTGELSGNVLKKGK